MEPNKIDQDPAEMKQDKEKRLVMLVERIRSEASKAGTALTFNLRLNFFGSMSVVM